jgi:hypothetical protein
MRANLVAVFVSLISGAAFAEETPATPSAVDPAWSVGGGLGLGSLIVGPVGGGSGIGLVATPVSQGNLFIERALGPRDWLLINLGGAYLSETTDVGAPPGYGTSKVESTSKYASALLGLRHVYTNNRVVDVSGWIGAGVTGSWLEIKGSYDYPGATPMTQKKSMSGLAAQVGLTLDRQLLEGLWVRLDVPLLAAAHSWGTTRSPGTPDRDDSSTMMGLAIRPSLQLRMVF